MRLLATLLLACGLTLGGACASAQSLPRAQHKSGDAILDVFKPAAGHARASIVVIHADGQRSVLGTVVDADGLVLTKASELPDEGQALTCHFHDGREAAARVVAVDDANDVALLKVEATNLTPVTWADQEPSVGRWVVTPGTDERPLAVGIVSVPPRRIPHQRALIGVSLDLNASPPSVVSVMEGMGAAEAGIRAGDVIVQAQGKNVKDREELIGLLSEYRDGQIVTLTIRRGEDEVVKEVRMSTPPQTGVSRFLDRQRIQNAMGGPLSERSDGFEQAIQHDTVLLPWQCGGPLINLQGQAVGLNIARAERVASYALSAELVQRLIEQLKQQAATEPVSEPVDQQQ